MKSNDGVDLYVYEDDDEKDVNKTVRNKNAREIKEIDTNRDKVRTRFDNLKKEKRKCENKVKRNQKKLMRKYPLKHWEGKQTSWAEQSHTRVFL